MAHDCTHDFDFWLGTWDVFGPQGRQVGTNTITALFGGTVLMEDWSGAGGIRGRSLNSWDANRRSWHQTWMDSTGSTLLLDGGLIDGVMVMQGTAPSGSNGRHGMPTGSRGPRPTTGARCASSGRRRVTTARPGRSASTGRTGGCPATRPDG